MKPDTEMYFGNCYLFAAGKKNDDLLLKVTPQKREEHVDFLVQLTHHIVLFQSGWCTAEKIGV